MTQLDNSWRIAKVLENKEIARATRWLKLQFDAGDPLEHVPGNVVSLSMAHGLGRLRHAYTVSGADSTSHTLDFIYRVIPDGRMTPHMADLRSGAEMQLYGRGGTPIEIEVATDPTGIVLVSTGTGIGPLYGYCRRALQQGLKLPLSLFCGFRESRDTCLQAELSQLSDTFPNFKWHFSLSRPDDAWPGLRGRLTESMPPLLGPLKNLHFHLVGNGDMVVEFYEALMQLGLKDERVTSEIYFNYPEYVDPERVKCLAEKFRLS